jgi:hypothetical protein
MKRYTALVRKEWFKPRTARRIKRETPEDKAWKRWIHDQPCVGHEWADHVCMNRLSLPTGLVEQSHVRYQTGLGLKPLEKQSLPMCGWLAWAFDEMRGPFAGMSSFERFAWAMPRLQDHWRRFEEWLHRSE